MGLTPTLALADGNDGAPTANSLTVDEYQAEKSKLLAFPDARITYVRCEVAKSVGTPRPAGCQ